MQHLPLLQIQQQLHPPLSADSVTASFFFDDPTTSLLQLAVKCTQSSLLDLHQVWSGYPNPPSFEIKRQRKKEKTKTTATSHGYSLIYRNMPHGRQYLQFFVGILWLLSVWILQDSQNIFAKKTDSWSCGFFRHKSFRRDKYRNILVFFRSLK